MPGATSSILPASSDALVTSSFLLLVVMPGANVLQEKSTLTPNQSLRESHM